MLTITSRTFVGLVPIFFLLENQTLSWNAVGSSNKEPTTPSDSRSTYLDLVREEFGNFDPYKLDTIWAIMCDNLRSTLKNRGGNDYNPEHNGRRKRQKDTGTAVDLTVPMNDYHECVRLVREYRRAHPLEKLPVGRKISSKLLLSEKLLAIP